MKSKKYSECVKEIFSRKKEEKPKNLKKFQKFLAALGHPHLLYKTVHIAGTNGKGSVATKFFEILLRSGYRVGLFISPHLYDFSERIQINRSYIKQSEVVKNFQEIFLLEKKLSTKLSFFEIATLLAFKTFAKEKVDIAIIETGLGGRLDPTNVVQPILSAITSISFDHTHILGDTLEKIAKEKAGIIKKNTPVVLGPHAVCQTIMCQAKRLKAPVIVTRGKNFDFYDDENQATVKSSLKILKKHHLICPHHAIKEGLACRPSCRYEKYEKNFPLIFDVAHNPSGFEKLFQKLFLEFPTKKIHVLFSLCKDKNIEACLEKIYKKNISWYLFPTNIARLRTPKEIADSLTKKGFCEIFQFSSLSKATHQAYMAASKNNEILLAIGSFYIMKGIKNKISRLEKN